jgi:flagellar basal body-associated protein FliL
MKIVIVAFLVLVLAALGGAGFFMLRRGPDAGNADASADKRMARVLAIRVGLSVTLFLLILLAWSLGWIHPSGIPVGT